MTDNAIQVISPDEDVVTKVIVSDFSCISQVHVNKVIVSDLPCISKVYVNKGIQGKSAYELALNNGFVGTEEQWLESLKTNIPITEENVGYLLSNDGDVVLWESLQNKLNIEQIIWDIGEI